MACDTWLRRDFLLRHDRIPDEPPCGHDPELCPPALADDNHQSTRES
jgi:hypothetical protein